MVILRKLRFINRGQQGFTMVELLAAIVITAIIGAAAAVGINQVVRINATSSNHETAIAQVENAVHNISRDTLQAQTIIPTITNFDLVAGNTLTMNWIISGQNNEIIYSIVNGTLQKKMTVGVEHPLLYQSLIILVLP